MAVAAKALVLSGNGDVQQIQVGQGLVDGAGNGYLTVAPGSLTSDEEVKARLNLAILK